MTRTLIGLAVLSAGLVGCVDTGPAPVPIPVPGEDGPWELVWSDEFDGAAGDPFDSTKWAYDLGGWGWGNAELQHYTDRVDNAYLDGAGHGVIEAKAEEFGGNTYTSARIKTQDVFSQQYGRFEARLLLPEGRSVWPAFWMLGDSFATEGWPDCGEIDIMELRGEDVDETAGTIHGPGYSGGSSIGGEYHHPDAITGSFEVFAVEWTEDDIRWMVNDELFFSAVPGDLPQGTPWAFDQPFFLILNVAVGGNFVLPVNEDTPDRARMGIDYVRVYRAAE